MESCRGEGLAQTETLPGSEVGFPSRVGEIDSTLAYAASGPIVMRKVDDCPSLSEKPSDQIIDLAAGSNNLKPLETD